ncbi:MAG: hypothetical protein KBF23_01180 [Agitococcus sp.]|nr:hypothetical protein [Agitococcus sp.]HQV81420.1 hypothetical protein [Agitococcus sp.]
MKKTAIALLCAFSVASCAQFPSGSNELGGQPRPAFQSTALGMATVTSLIVLMEVKRQKVQQTLQKQTNSAGIAKYQARLTAMDAVKGNLASYASGQLSLGDKLSLINATTDIVRTKLPEYGDVLTTLSTLGQVLITAQQQAAQQAK